MLLRKWWMGLAMAALGTQQAFALACSGTIYVQPPAEWDSLYVMTEGSFYPVPSGAREGSWYRLNAEDYGRSYYEYFFLTGANADFYKTVNKAGWITSISSLDSYFSCKDLASGELFISKDSVSGGTRASSTPPSARNFYFGPPSDKAWSKTKAWALFADGSKRKLDMDLSRCGWFKMRFLDEAPSEAFRLSPDSLGSVSVEVENLQARFAQSQTGVLLWNSQMGQKGWGTDASIGNGGCKQKLTASFYDTDASLHGAFSCDSYPYRAGNSCVYPGVSWPADTAKSDVIPCIGVTPGIVSSSLPASGKPAYQAASGCFESAGKFDQLFSPVPGVNEVSEAEFALRLASDGYWTFDTMEELDQGFFPLENAPASGVGTKRQAYGGMLYGTGYAPTWNKAAAALGVKSWGSLDPVSGLPFIDLYPTAAGDFADGINPNVYDGSYWNLRIGKNGTVGSESYTLESPMLKNQHYCMETHASFIYQGGERFHVRGDDDIWVYVDKRLVIDLGGMHLSAPGYVLLDTLGLTRGSRYPLDFFFCDRRTSMSNLRIKTDLVLEAPDAGTVGVKQLATARQEVSWESAVRKSGGTLALRDLQGKVLWSASLPVEASTVRAQVSAHQGLSLLQVGSRAWLLK